MKRAWKFLGNFTWPAMIPALAVATVLYYFVCRWLQDHLLPIDSSAILHVLSANLRILPEPYEILLYFFGYLAIPLIAWWLCRFFRWSAPVQCAVWAKIKRPTVIGIGVPPIVLLFVLLFVLRVRPEGCVRDCGFCR